MKTLLVRPGVEVMKMKYRESWSPEMSYLEKIYRDPLILFRALAQYGTFSPTSVLAVASVLKGLGEDVEYLDVPLEFGLPLTEESTVKRRARVENYIAEGGYDIVGISCTSSLEGTATLSVAEAAKRALGDVNVIVGGYHAVTQALDMMEKIPAIDVIVLSDFEPIAEHLYASFNGIVPIKDVPNILYKENGSIHTSERKRVKLENIPVFDYSLLKKYIKMYSFFTIEASRGCPFNCSFCQEKALRDFYMVKDAESAVSDLINAASYIAQFMDHVFFGYSDSLWGVNPKWVKDFCSELIKRKDEIRSDTFMWGCESRIGQFDDEALPLMKKAGCAAVGYGVESLSPKMLKMMDKTRDPQKYIASVFDIVEKTLRADMQTVLFFILGLPGETPFTIEESLESMRKLPLKDKKLHLKIGLPTVLPGTALYGQIHDSSFAEKYGVKILDEFDWEKNYLPRFTLLFNPSRELSASEMTDIYLDLIHGGRDLPAIYGKQLEAYEDIKTLMSKEEIPPEELVRGGRIFRKIMAGVF